MKGKGEWGGGRKEGKREGGGVVWWPVAADQMHSHDRQSLSSMRVFGAWQHVPGQSPEKCFVTGVVGEMQKYTSTKFR